MSIQWLLDKMAQNSNEVAIINSHEQITYGDILRRYDNIGGVATVEGYGYTPPEISEFVVAMVLHCGTENVPIEIMTSGTTGKPQVTHHQIADLIAPFKDKQLEKQRMIFYLMVDHIGGLNTLLRSLVSCSTLIIPDDRGVDGVCRAIEEHKAEVLPATPSFLNMLLMRGAHKEYDLDSLKVISFGTEVMTISLINRLKLAFPVVRFVQAYGTTELGILRTQTHPDNPLYIHFPDPEVWVDGGTLWVKGKDTGDEVDYFFEEGKTWMRIVGRKSDVINVGGIKVHPHEVEEVLMRMEGVQDVVCYGEVNSIMGKIVVAKFNLKDGVDSANWKEKVWNYCEDEGVEKHCVPLKVIVTSEELFSARGKKARK